jgi:dTMP kinase
MHLKHGLFIVFEGLDGSGSSTQARLLKDALSRELPKVYLTAEPSAGPVGQLIRLAMSHRVVFSDDEAADDRQLAYLFAADRYDHLHNKVDGVLKQMANGAVVISTRYYLSSFAYHCRTDDDFARVARLNEEFPPADLTFYIDCPVETCLRRIEQRQFVSEKYEHRAKLVSVRDNFEKALANYPHELHRLDGEAPPDDLHQQVLEIVRRKIATQR